MLLSAGISYFLYQNNPLNIANIWLRRLLYFLRFGVIFLILFLVLGPLFQLKLQRIDKPIIALLIDNSSSMVQEASNKAAVNASVSELLKFQQDLGENYLVKTYTIGEQARLNESISFSEKQSNLSEGIKTISEAHYNLNLAGIILASDGIYNAGEQPLYEAIQQKTRIYTIAFGDSSRKKDVWIKHVKHNEIVFEGNNYLVQANIAANYFKGSFVEYSITENSKTILSGKLNLANDPASESLILNMPAASEGLHTYQLRLKPLSGEQNTLNNVYSFQIESLKSKQKIVLLAQSPHPDISALVQTLKLNPNFEVFSYLIQDYKEENINEASLFILHQLPGLNGSGETLIKTLKQKNKPIFFVLGKQSSANSLAHFGIINIVGPSQNFNETQGWINENFSQFIVEEQLSEFVKKAPPLISLYGTYKVSADASILLNQQLGYVKTSNPLLFFSQAKGMRYSVLAGEGFWKWRLHDFFLNQNQFITQNLISKIVQWTASNADQGRFRIYPMKKRFNETEAILFEAEIYNESFELIQNQDIAIKILGDNGRSYLYNLSKNGKGYDLNAGRIGPGIYTYEASVINNKSFPIKKGKFIVQALQTELVQTKADHGMLNTLAIETGGSMFFPSELNKLKKALQENAQIKPIIYEEEDTQLLINSKLLFGLLILMLTIEWLIRKWNGYI